MKDLYSRIIPCVIGLFLGILLYFVAGWWGFLIVFPWIGTSITIGLLIARNKKREKKDIGRRIAILLIAPIFLFFLGYYQRENLQLEEAVFYLTFFLSTSLFIRVLVHYTVAKVFGPLIWGRGFCAWACWTAAVLEWLPIKENKLIPNKYTRWRFVSLSISLLLPLVLIYLGYDFVNLHINGEVNEHNTNPKFQQLIWFMVSNGVYYSLGIPFAFIFKKKRAFCKILCPVSLIMKVPTRFALLKVVPSGEICIDCSICNKNCPMDVNVVSYIKKNEPITSTECINCRMCSNVCPQGAIK